MGNFDTIIERQGSACEKYDRRQQKFGREDVLPLWVADMDFAAPDCVQQALAERLKHPVFGYSYADSRVYQSLYEWFEQRHHWQIDPALCQLVPGVVPSLFAAVQALTNQGDGVIVPTPVYPPFFSAVTQSQRQLLVCPLIEDQQGYHLDFERLEQQATQAKMLLLCSPHNPVGRVWQREELSRLIELALKHQLVIVSDEIHCDLVYSGFHHTVLASIAPKALRLVTAVSPSKTFNIPGLNLSALLCSHAADQQAISQVFERLHVNPFNPLSLVAFKAAYRDGAPWLEALMRYLAGNRQRVLDFIERQALLTCHAQQASCLMWLDCRPMGLDDQALRQFFIQAGLGLNEGLSFGQAGSGFMRLNIGTQAARLTQALSQLEAAILSLPMQ